jgi:hypothetical protein
MHVCLLPRRKRPFSAIVAMSQKGHERTHVPRKTAFSFDHLIDPNEEIGLSLLSRSVFRLISVDGASRLNLRDVHRGAPATLSICGRPPNHGGRPAFSRPSSQRAATASDPNGLFDTYSWQLKFGLAASTSTTWLFASPDIPAIV